MGIILLSANTLASFVLCDRSVFVSNEQSAGIDMAPATTYISNVGQVWLVSSQVGLP